MRTMRTIAQAAAIPALALASAAQASVVYTFTGEYVSERDDAGNTLATSTATWSFTATDFVTSAADIVPDSCDSGNAAFFCAPTQRMEPYPTSFGNAIGADYIGLNLTTENGGGTGFYWFRPGAFGAVGVYSNQGWPDPFCDGEACYGNAGIATLTVGMGGNAVPEPASWALLITGFGLAGMAMRRRVAPRYVTA